MEKTEIFNIEHLEQELPEIAHWEDEMTFIQWLQLTRNTNVGQLARKKKQLSMIENFIKADPKIQPVRHAISDIKDLELEDKDKPVVKLEMIVSETLAKIYRQQKKYALAIDTYKKLGLVFPEKNSYFARLIKEVKEESERQ